MRPLRIALMMGLALLVAGAAQAGVADGPHNMNNWPGVTGLDGQICVPCHAPHRAVNFAAGPLWNHAMTATSFDQGGRTDVLDHESKLCMSCHDGITAVSAFGGATSPPLSDVLTGDLAIWTTNGLEDDHPMGVTYPTSGHGWWSETEDPDEWDDVQGLLADDGTVQCGSCHRAHSASIRGPVHGEPGTVGSKLCLMCHDR